MDSKILTIIDADGLLYHCSKDTLEESIEILDSRIEDILLQTNANYYVIFISNSPYFRHEICPEYKSQRKKYKTTLKWLKCLKSYLIENWNAQSMRNTEADDLCKYWYNQDIWGYISDSDIIRLNSGFHLRYIGHPTHEQVCLESEGIIKDENWDKFNIILSSPDKDLLNSIPGKHFNYTYRIKPEIKEMMNYTPDYKVKDEDLIKGWWVETSESKADEFKRMQCVVGDAADSIKSIEGRGEKYWEKISKDTIPSWGDILQEYITKYDVTQGIYEFQKNYRLLHLLENDEDFEREVGYIPQFPEIQKVNKNVEEDIL